MPKPEIGVGNILPMDGNIFISVNDIDKMKVIPINTVIFMNWVIS